MSYTKFQSLIQLEKLISDGIQVALKHPYLESIYRKYVHNTRSFSKQYEVFLPDVNPNGIKDKTALVIGGSCGIGLDCVHQLLSNGVKAVMIADDNEEEGKELLKRLCDDYGVNNTSFIKTDISNIDLLIHTFSTTVESFQGLDIVVNDNRHKDCENWEHQIDYNIKGFIRSTLLAMECMGVHAGGKGGIVVNVVSKGDTKVMSKHGIPLFDGVRYFATGFNKSVVAQYYKLTGVKVLSLCPEETTDSYGCKEVKYNLVKLLGNSACGT